MRICFIFLLLFLSCDKDTPTSKESEIVLTLGFIKVSGFLNLAFRTFKIKGDIFLASARAAPSNAIDFEKVGLQKRVLNYYSYSNELFLKN